MNAVDIAIRQAEIDRLVLDETDARDNQARLTEALKVANARVFAALGQVATARRRLEADIALGGLDQEVVRLARYAMTRFKAVKRLAEHNNLMHARHTVEMAIEHGTLKREHGEYALLSAVAEILNYDQAAASNDARDAAWRLKMIMSRQIVHDNELKRIQQQGVQA